MQHVKSVQFHPDGTTVFEYIEVPGDFRDNGMAQSRYLMVPPELIAVVDQIEELTESAQLALKAATREFSAARAMDPEEALREGAFGPIEQVKEDIAGYDNPEEREQWRD